MKMSFTTRQKQRGTPFLLVLLGVIAAVFVGQRVSQLTEEINQLSRQLRKAISERNQYEEIFNKLDIHSTADLLRLKAPKPCQSETHTEPEMDLLEIPFINVVPSKINNELPFTGPDVDNERVHSVGSYDNEVGMPPISGKVVLVEDGIVYGWACAKGDPQISLEVRLFVNDVFAASTYTRGEADHPEVSKFCDDPSYISETSDRVDRAFKVTLPRLEDGIYTLKAFVYSANGVWRKELMQSPQQFVESMSKPGLSDWVKRKDEVIRARNAQVAALYERLFGRGIWSMVKSFERVEDFGETVKGNKYLAFVGLISNPNEIHNREVHRQTWFPTREGLDKIAKEKKIILRFIIGKSDWMTETEMAAIRQEMKEHRDIMVVDMRGFEDAAKKALAFFSAVAFNYDVDFVFKGDKDTVVDVDSLAHYLEDKTYRGNLYMGCMKSGEVIRSAREKFHEPEHWRFGDSTAKLKANYPRHAERQFLGVSQLVARYLAQNGEVMRYYANDDVSVGTWLLGLEVEFVNNRQFCCQALSCKPVDSVSLQNRCIAYSDKICSGVCRPDTMIPRLYSNCLSKSSTKN